MPKQKPHQSKQDYGTPGNLVQALEYKLGEKISFDLAASLHNAKRDNYFTESDNSLVQDWHKIKGLLWLNPPFSNIGLWAAKCLKESKLGAHIAMLTPASVGTNWFADNCHGNSLLAMKFGIGMNNKQLFFN